MLFKTAAISIITLLFANQAMGAVIEDRAALTATDAYSACNCPNNCSHSKGSSCTYRGGPSDSSKKIYGYCYKPNGSPTADLQCIPK
ncbi:hypothetical protein F5B20DRAFT_58212 [Whalleya microplaca]|nr:hypothetical protein F5B20DRAFT_58212 [Whalleya microplaca]